MTDISSVQLIPRVGPRSRRERVRRLLQSKTVLVGLSILVFWTLCAAFGSLVVPQDPYSTDATAVLAAPSDAHWFGTDRTGRDIFSRVIVGSRDILIIATSATVLGTLLGTTLGLITGFYRGIVDDAIGRVIDAILALPGLIIASLAIVALGPTKLTVIAVVGIIFAPIIARTVRAAVLSERELEYVAAARLRNERSTYIMFREILPNVWGTVMVEFTVRLGYAVFTVAGLSFLGVGIQPPAPDWGLQVFEHYGLVSSGYWWPVLFPALAITSLVVSVNLVADGASRVDGR